MKWAFYAISCGVLLLSQCSFFGQQQKDDRTYRNDALMRHAKNGNKKLVVILYEQTGILYVNNQRAMSFPVSTGIPGHGTPTGRFSIENKEHHHKSSLYGSIYDCNGTKIIRYASLSKDKVPPGGYFDGASMPYSMFFTPECALHVGDVPDTPMYTSHGCIHLQEAVAKELYSICPIGTPVEVLENDPDASMMTSL